MCFLNIIESSNKCICLIIVAGVHTLQSDTKHMNVVGNISVTFEKYYARGRLFGTHYTVRINTD